MPESDKTHLCVLCIALPEYLCRIRSMGIAKNKNGVSDSVPSLAVAGVLTICLVWYTSAISLPSGLEWIDDQLRLHISAALFLILSLLLNVQRLAQWQPAILFAQTVCAAVFIATDVAHSGPILNIVLVAQMTFVLGLRATILWALVINAVHVWIRVQVHDEALTDAFLGTALFMTFQVFAVLIGHYALQVNRARDDLAATNAELMATRSLLESTARDRERLRVSRDLHDTAGHMLTALKLNLRQLRDSSSGEQRVALADCLQLSSDLLEEIRSLVGKLREQDPLDLEHALAELTQPFVRPRFTVDVASDVAINDLAIAENLLAVAREAITNVVRHANASQCAVSVNMQQGQVRLSVVDDGIGTSGSEGFGIKGMRERVQSLAGALEISRNQPQGTQVSAVWNCS